MAEKNQIDRKSNLPLVYAIVAVLAVIVVAALASYFYSAPQGKQMGNPNTTLHPIDVVSVQGVMPQVPAGVIIRVTLKANSTADAPVTKLTAKLFIIGKNGTFNFLKINQSNPLISGQTALQTLSIIGPAAYFSDSPYPLFIEGTLQNGQTFSYWTNVTISEPYIKPPTKTLRPISVVASAQSGPPPCTPVGNGYECNPAGPPTWISVTVNASSTDVPVIQLSTVVLDYDRELLVCDNFGINEKNPLMPGQNASTTCGYRGLGAPVYLFIVNGTPAVFVEGMLQNGQSFSYWTNETSP
ncbi:MAG: hypothetical protein OIN85_03025 [Candidatus Methanoperedens sp.]|nr:hypothetical protein [Candidatus Methanoperedens sp.]